MNSYKGYVGGFPEKFLEDDLKKAFQAVGEIENITACCKKYANNKIYFELDCPSEKDINKFIYEYPVLCGHYTDLKNIIGSMFETYWTFPIKNYAVHMEPITNYLPSKSDILELEDDLLIKIFTPSVYPIYKGKFLDSDEKEYHISLPSVDKPFPSLPPAITTIDANKNNSKFSLIGDAFVNNIISLYIYDNFSGVDDDVARDLIAHSKSNVIFALVSRKLGFSSQAGLTGNIDKRDSDIFEAYIGGLVMKLGTDHDLAMSIATEFVHRCLGGLMRHIVQDSSFLKAIGKVRKRTFHKLAFDYFGVKNFF